ncbi:DUF4855 domain-containing protein [Paenibacillus mendelii]|uniref:DUF4855 domain-containing protein n=1 Tax=Paenibacillus mendelii TaxID=206163 RepID=A0ABV6J6W9_9BACL
MDGSGSLNFNDSAAGKEKAFENRKKAVQWWLDQVRQRWQAENYSNLELVGMYWMPEQIEISESGPDMILAVTEKVHAMNMKVFWIPHSLAYKMFMWKDVGVDAAAYQPNYFFGGMDSDRLEDAANNAKRYGMGNEVEFDDGMLTDPVLRERFIEYLDSGVRSGLMQNGFRAYYQGNNAVYNLGASQDPNLRLMYDWLYQYLNGTYAIDSSPAPETMAELVHRYISSNEINSAFGNELSYRLQIIKQLLDENKPNEAVTYMQDFLAHIHDPAVQAQGLISVSAASVLDSYAQVLIQAWSDGWGLSNLVLGQTYTISRRANSNYPDSGNELTNGQFGGEDFRNEQWQGHAGNDYPEERSRTITFDLGGDKSIGQIKAHFLQDKGPGIYFPQNVTYSVSSDGQSWSKLATVSPTPSQNGASAEFMRWDGAKDGVPGNAGADKVYARYVKVEFPVNVWVFLDEIEVLGINGKTDQTAPVTTAAVSPEQPDGQNGWYKQPVTVSLTAEDKEIGIAQTEYSLDGGTSWQTYTQPLVFDKDGSYSISYRSTDSEGNVEEAKAVNFKIDAAAPVITIAAPVDGTYTSADKLTLQFAVSDALSGVDASKTVAMLDGKAVQAGSVVDLYHLEPGAHEFTVTAADLSGNTASSVVRFQVAASLDSLKALVQKFYTDGWIDNKGIANSLQSKLEQGNAKSFINQVEAQAGKHIASEAATILLRIARAL